MKVFSIKTHKIKPFESNLFNILDKYLKSFEEGSILVITSKIVSICQNRVVEKEKTEKDDLIKKQADYFLLPNQYNTILTIKDNILLPAAGIDESNAMDYYILWPKNIQKTANEIRKYLISRFSVKKIGVIITDSKTTILRRGTTGIGLAHSGFLALNNCINKPDIFGRKLKITKINILDSLASSAVLLMGESNEQTPLAVIQDIPFVKFQKRNPSKKERQELKIKIKDDLYSVLLNSVNWKKGYKRKIS